MKVMTLYRMLERNAFGWLSSQTSASARVQTKQHWCNTDRTLREPLRNELWYDLRRTRANEVDIPLCR